MPSDRLARISTFGVTRNRLDASQTEQAIRYTQRCVNK